MAHIWSTRSGTVLLGIYLLLAQSIALADERTGPELLPPSTVLYFELRDPKAVVQLVMDHPLSQRIQSVDAYRKAFESKEYLRFKAGLAVVEAQMEMPWRPLVEKLTDGGIYVGFDAKTKGAALLVRSSDAATPQKLVDTVIQLAQLDPAVKEKPDAIKSVEYRGITGHSVGKAIVAAAKNWLVVCNNHELGKSIADRLLDGGESLASVPSFGEARGAANHSLTGWGFANIAQIRELGETSKFFKGPMDNPVGELLVGGIVANLQQTPHATLELSLSASEQRVALAAPHDPGWVGEVREYYFGPGGKGQAPSPLTVPEQIFSLRTYRDFAGMWLRAGDLFDEKINDGFAKADSQLATLFSGKDFGEDILGAIQPEIQIVVARQSFENAKVVPTIKLPSFALVSRLKDTDTMQPELRRIFQSLIGFLNIVGAMEGQPQFEMDIDKQDGRQLLSATYVPDANKKPTLPGAINHNFSPSIAFFEDYFIVSSSRALAHELSMNAGKTAPANISPVNTEAVLEYSVLRKVLQDNRGQLIAQTMLQEGKGKEQAGQQTDLLLNLLEYVQDSQIRLTSGKELRVEFTTKLQVPESAK